MTKLWLCKIINSPGKTSRSHVFVEVRIVKELWTRIVTSFCTTGVATFEILCWCLASEKRRNLEHFARIFSLCITLVRGGWGDHHGLVGYVGRTNTFWWSYISLFFDVKVVGISIWIVTRCYDGNREWRLIDFVGCEEHVGYWFFDKVYMSTIPT